MSGPLGSSQWMYATDAGYNIDQSLRFDGSSSTLHRTPSAAGNQRTWTWSCWFKRSVLGTYQNLFGTDYNTSGNYGGYIAILDTNKLRVYSNLSGSVQMHIDVDMLFRDVSSFYHLLVAFDSTEASAGDRVKVYVNGSLVTYTTTTAPALNLQGQLNDGERHDVGSFYANSSSTWHWNGYMAEVHFIDGTALDATSFGETINGIWVPKAYSGSYGTNGFYLSFSDSAAIGDDLSGNTNDFTANNLAASDIVPDSPTNNFATFNALEKHSATALSEGNLVSTSGNANDWECAGSTMHVSSGKWYCEIELTAASGTLDLIIGVARSQSFEFLAGTTFYTPASNYGYYASVGDVYAGGVVSGNFNTTYAVGDIIGIAIDMDNLAVYFSKNGTFINSGDPTSGASKTGLSGALLSGASYQVAVGAYQNGTKFTANFGQDGTFAGGVTAGGNSDGNGVGDFKYSVPSGYLALCTSNLPEPTIGPNSTTTSDQNFNTLLYTGDGSTGLEVNGLSFTPDWLWIKRRDSLQNFSNAIVDSVRGNTKNLVTNRTDAESTSTGTNDIQSFDSDGFTTGPSNQVSVNDSGGTFVAWCWKAGGTAVSNTDGSITSSVSANPDAGFSIVSYTGTGANATVGHGLSSAPEMIIIKARTRAENWLVYHKFDGGTDGRSFLNLNTTGAKFDNGPNSYFQDTPPTSSVFYQNGSSYNVNTDTYIAYCFHSSDVCKVGSYVGNGNADGTFVFTGFRPAFVLLKKSSASGDNWSMYDNKRDVDNPVREYLIPNDSQAAGATDTMDFVSNGFKVRNSGAYINTSGATYIYFAFAEAPFKHANAR